MAILSTLIKLSPVVAAPTIGAGFLAVHFEGTPMEEILPIEEVDNTPAAPLQPKRSSAPGKAGRKYTSGRVNTVYGTVNNTGRCNIYALEDQEDQTNSLIFRFFKKYDNLQKVQEYVRSKGGNLERTDHIGCNNNQHVYVYEAYRGHWTFKMGEREPIFEE
ncbi:hypothetical protein MHF_0887 [Mycoplasma haemofelis Ohio2]|uniref:Uncharacterized protein n=1 Tax=Mycoplasma haemofelis (strain Ohio2) TaxID=859194 RepID=F6FIU7_MYCHI|nr:hypothetical protein MHF_0887 [Mycoplasma haemofelis Ohio2]